MNSGAQLTQCPECNIYFVISEDVAVPSPSKILCDVCVAKKSAPTSEGQAETPLNGQRTRETERTPSGSVAANPSREYAAPESESSGAQMRRGSLVQTSKSFSRSLMPRDLISPFLAVMVLSAIGLALIRPEHTVLWWVATLLILSGAFLSVFWGAMVGLILIASALPWIFLTSQEIFFRAEILLVIAVFPLLPLFFAAARMSQEQTSILKMLLDIPQVRASLDVSDWSLLPTPRALDRRLMLHAEEQRRMGRIIPAILFKIEFQNIEKSGFLLGEVQLKLMTAELCDKMRGTLRKGDMITEDMRTRGQIYILTFPNPEFPNNLEVLTRKISSILDQSTLPKCRLFHAICPDDGERFNLMNWKPSI